MSAPITLRVCSYFRPEVDHFLRDQGLSSRFQVQEFPSLCQGIPATGLATGLATNQAASLGGSRGQSKIYGTLIIAGHQCPALSNRAHSAGQTIGNTEHNGIRSGACLSLIAPKWLLENLVREGSYLVSPGWLADWEKNVAAWGFDASGLRDFARDSMRQVCLLDTFTLPDSEKHLAAFSKALGLPAMRIPVGMTHCSTVFQAAIDSKPAEPRPGADYAMALDLISRLGHFQDENQVISQLLEILSMLFAPGTLTLVRYQNGKPEDIRKLYSEEAVLDEATTAICDIYNLNRNPANHKDGLALPIDFDKQRLALVFMTDLAMPESRNSYRNLLESIIPIFSLSLINARNYEALIKNEKSLQEKQQELLDTLEFRDRLLAIIAHDLRGPIGGMGDMLQLLGESLESSISDREMQFLSEIILAAQSASSLLLNLLEWAKLQTTALELAPKFLSARDEAATIVSIMQSQATLKTIELRNEADPAHLVYADQNVMQTILRNLVSNALKYSRPGDTVTVRTSQENGSHRIDIIDSGIGMDEATLARALDFSRRRSMAGTKGERGSGLGLVFCKELAEKSGASIVIESTLGIGTRVSLIFQRTV